MEFSIWEALKCSQRKFNEGSKFVTLKCKHQTMLLESSVVPGRSHPIYPNILYKSIRIEISFKSFTESQGVQRDIICRTPWLFTGTSYTVTEFASSHHSNFLKYAWVIPFVSLHLKALLYIFTWDSSNFSDDFSIISLLHSRNSKSPFTSTIRIGYHPSFLSLLQELDSGYHKDLLKSKLISCFGSFSQHIWEINSNPEVKWYRKAYEPHRIQPVRMQWNPLPPEQCKYRSTDISGEVSLTVVTFVEAKCWRLSIWGGFSPCFEGNEANIGCLTNFKLHCLLKFNVILVLWSNISIP